MQNPLGTSKPPANRETPAIEFGQNVPRPPWPLPDFNGAVFVEQAFPARVGQFGQLQSRNRDIALKINRVIQPDHFGPIPVVLSE
jgi:hypothetical protein